MKINWSGITQETWVRTIVTIIIVGNLILKSLGMQPIEIEENTVAALVEAFASVFGIGWAWWKNNSFTKKAQSADKTMKSGE